MNVSIWKVNYYMKPKIVIIGGGVTGLTSALWCWRLGHPALLIDSAPLLGGQLHLAHGLMIDLPAMNPMTGPSLARRLWRQFMQHNGRWLRAELKHLEADASGCNLFLQGTTSAGEQWEKTLRARTAIISTGVRRKNLEVPGEKKFYGRGILHTAAKGRKFLNGKMVAVIGGGDSACENALLLTQAGARVTLIHHGPRLSARHQFAHEIQHHSGITLRLDTQVRGFMGSEALESLSLEHQGREEVLPVQAALIRVGWVPNSEMLPGHWLDPRGYVKANPTGEITGQTSVFAAGDILGQLAPSVTTAFGGGAIAARAAVAFLERD
jgi:thioredoxin reductase (NADPH)